MSFPSDLKAKTLNKIKKLNIKEEDIEEKFTKGSGKGGQKINKTESCVFLKHLPTNISVKCQAHRERSNNLLTAYRLLVDKIEEEILGKKSEKAKKIYKLRKQKKRRSKKAKEKMLKEKAKKSDLKKTRKKITPPK